MINEGARILDEGIAERAGDIDVIWIHGYGFPAVARWADVLREHGRVEICRGSADGILEAGEGSAAYAVAAAQKLASEGKGFE